MSIRNIYNAGINQGVICLNQDETAVEMIKMHIS